MESKVFDPGLEQQAVGTTVKVNVEEEEGDGLQREYANQSGPSGSRS